MDGLYILPFDHRSSFMKLVKAASPQNRKDIARARGCKRLIYDAFRKSVAEGVPKSKAAVLVDEWLGRDILKDARSKGFITCVALEKSGQGEFNFDRKDWRKQVKQINPTYAKVLVRYNPEGSKKVNARQSARLAELSSFLKTRKNKLLLELLVPAAKKQLAKSMAAYDKKIRPYLMVAAIRELQEAGVNPDVWKIEGLDSVERMQKVADQVKAGNPKSRIVILGRGESREKAERWLKVGAKVNSAIGFAVGRTVFNKPIEQYNKGKISKAKAIMEISQMYTFFVKVWERARG
ncbi:DUF2090 domain-containing protein [Candidatus Woesearchaeota archaeon]|nr:DUF2090 domain-containing protein [Candidatus Woesearchaeota archaeon]